MKVEGGKNCCCYHFCATDSDKTILVIYALAIALIVAGSYGLSSGQLPLATSRNLTIAGCVSFVIALAGTYNRGFCRKSLPSETKETIIKENVEGAYLTLALTHKKELPKLPGEYHQKSLKDIGESLNVTKAKLATFPKMNPMDAEEVGNALVQRLASQLEKSPKEVERLLTENLTRLKTTNPFMLAV